MDGVQKTRNCAYHTAQDVNELSKGILSAEQWKVTFNRLKSPTLGAELCTPGQRLCTASG